MKKANFLILSTLKNIWPFLILIVLGLAILRFFINPGFPQTHDGQNHLARLANLDLAFIGRNFPPRWAPNLNSKFGYPVFEFNYYLPQLLAMVPAKLGFSFESSLKLIILFSFLTGGIFWFLFLRRYFSKLAALIGSLFYMTAPYQIVAILVRGSMGEVVAFLFWPLLFLLFDILAKKPGKFIFSLTVMAILAFLLTHNITVLFGFPLLAIFALLLSWKKPGQKLVILAFLLGIGLSLFFWLPALLEKSFTNIDQVNLTYQYKDHFPSLSQLFYSPWGYGFSFPGKNDGLSFELGPFHWLALVLSFTFLIFSKKKKNSKNIKFFWYFFTALFLLSLLAMNQMSLPLWELLPLVHYIQFPWRLLMLTIVASVFPIAWLAEKKPFLALILGTASVVYILLIVKPGGWFNWNDDFYYNFPFTTSILKENMPRWFNQDKNIKLKGFIFGLDENEKPENFSWKSSKHAYTLKTNEKKIIAERTAYFPGWKLFIDKKETAIDYQTKKYPGMIAYELPAGKHDIEVKFSEKTFPRIIGDTISLLSLLMLGILLLPVKKINNGLFKKSN